MLEHPTKENRILVMVHYSFPDEGEFQIPFVEVDPDTQEIENLWFFETDEQVHDTMKFIMENEPEVVGYEIFRLNNGKSFERDSILKEAVPSK